MVCINSVGHCIRRVVWLLGLIYLVMVLVRCVLFVACLWFVL